MTFFASRPAHADKPFANGYPLTLKIQKSEVKHEDDEKRIEDITKELRVLRKRVRNKKKRQKILQFKMSMDAVGQEASKKLEEILSVCDKEKEY